MTWGTCQGQILIVSGLKFVEEICCRIKGITDCTSRSSLIKAGEYTQNATVNYSVCQIIRNSNPIWRKLQTCHTTVGWMLFFLLPKNNVFTMWNSQWSDKLRMPRIWTELWDIRTIDYCMVWPVGHIDYGMTHGIACELSELLNDLRSTKTPWLWNDLNNGI